MRRQLVGAVDRPEIEFREVSADDLARIDRLIERFREATPHNNKTLCVLLRSDIRAGCLRTETLERLSVWCHTRQPPNGGSEAAQDLAFEMLGVVPRRLRDVGEHRVDDYESHINVLSRSLGVPAGQ